MGRLDDEEYRRLKWIFLFVVLACLLNPQTVRGALYPVKVFFQISGESKIFFDNIVELHMSKIKVMASGEAIDFHGAPDDVEFAMLSEVMEKVEKECDVVIEYWKDAEGLVKAYDMMEA